MTMYPVYSSIPSPGQVAELYPPGATTIVEMPEAGLVAACYGLPQSIRYLVGCFPPGRAMRHHLDSALLAVQKEQLGEAVESLQNACNFATPQILSHRALTCCLRRWAETLGGKRETANPLPGKLWLQVFPAVPGGVREFVDSAEFEISLLIAALFETRERWRARLRSLPPQSMRIGDQLAWWSDDRSSNYLCLGPNRWSEFPAELDTILQRAIATKTAIKLARETARDTPACTVEIQPNLLNVATEFARGYGAREVSYSHLVLALLRFSRLPEAQMFADFLDFSALAITSVFSLDDEVPLFAHIDRELDRRAGQ